MNSQPSADQFDLGLLPSSKSPDKKGLALLGGAFVILVALLLSGSRGGIAATALGLFVLGALTLRLRKQQFAEQREAIIVVGALLVAATFLVFGDVVAREDRAARLPRRESHGGLHRSR